MVMARFSFRFDPRYATASRPFLIRPERAWVEVGDGWLRSRFGPWSLETPLSNIARVDVTGPYLFVKTAGPARLGVTDVGLTFATNGDRGVLITFKDKVQGAGPYRPLKHPELTVTVEDIDGLVAALSARST
jgi:hypothetical protein